MKKILLTLLLAPLCAMTILAQDPIAEPDSVFAQTLDSAVIEDPEWYVAPISLDSLLARRLAPRRAAADACPIDSVQHFNVDSILTGVSVYEYGDTTRTLTWTINPDGSRFGTSRTEEGTNGDITFSASYDWDFEANDWKGTSKEEHTYTGGKETLRTLYTWINGAWTPDTKYTWTYDAAGRETEYTTYTRNTTTNELVYSKQRLREYNAAGRTTLDIQYTAHNGTAWSAGTKELWDFNTSNLQTLHEKYSLANSDWTITLREIKGYDAANNNDLIENYALQSNVWKGTKKEEYVFNSAKKKTSSIVYAWSNGAWVGSAKELWEYNGPSSKQTLHEKFSWSNEDWAISLQENSGYDEAGNTISVENYTITNGVWKGSKKITYTFNSSNKQIGNVTYKWTNNAWVNNVWTVTGYDAAGNKNESCTYRWTNDTWTGYGTRTLTTFNGSKKPIEVTNQTWSADAASWVNSTRKTTEYSGSKTTQEASYAWSTELNDWIGVSRSDWHYNAAGQNDTIRIYTPNGAEWIFSSRTVKTYNAAGVEIMVHNADWQNDAWVMTSMTRKDIIKDAAGHELLNASWSCGADSVWNGIQKDSAAYTASGKNLYKLHCPSWANGDWVPEYRIEYEYDDVDRLISEQRFDWTGTAWRGNYRNEYGFDEQGRQNMTARYISWNTITNNWIGTTKTMQTFDENGHVLVSVSCFWGVDTWRPAFQYTYTYDAIGREIDRVTERYVNEEWANYQKHIKEYNGNVLVKDNEYIWQNSEWMFSSRNETYYDDDAQAKLRREVIGLWDSNTGELQSFADDHYFYDCDYPYYTIRFVNYNGEELASYSLKEGKTPTYKGATPTKPSDESTYTFAGWSPAIVPVIGDATYTATFTAVQNSYTITWLDENGAQLAQTVVEAGTIPAYPNENPTKQADAQYTYTFAGWTPEIVAATADAIYTATFSNTVNQYTITFKNGETVLQSTEVAYGEIPAYNGETPVKQGDAQYTYAFAGWDADLVAVTGEATYNATFSNTENKYTIIFKNGETVLQTSEVEYGQVPSYNGETPTKQGDAQYTYTFAGWDAELVAVTGEATYNATFNNTVNQYTITFKNGESVLQTSEVEYGQIPAYNGETPVKQGDAQYTYSFAGWDAELVAVTGEATYNATFTSTVNKYLITFKNGETVLQTSEVEYGQIPAYNGETPVKQGDAQYTYSFAGWDAELVAVTGEATYNATFTSTVNKYLITFKNGEEVLQTSEVEYGQVPAYNGETPTKQGDAQYTYTFAGWDAELVAVTGEATYNATFTSTTNAYTITWLNSDNSPLDQTTVEYGVTPTAPADPTKESTAQYTYTFAGWSPAIVPVTGEATYTATFDSVVNTYTIIFYFEDGVTIMEQQVLPYGEMPSPSMTPSKENDGHYYYHFDGWSPEIAPVTGDASYTPIFTAEPMQYTITFKNFNDRILQTSSVPYGVMPEYTGATPEKQRDAQYTYVFIGWDPELTTVEGDATYTAVFEAVLNQYTILFLNEDGTELDRQSVDYGAMPEYHGETPTKADDEQYRYVFAGWTPALTEVTKDATYRATYTRHDKHEGIGEVPSDQVPSTKVMIDGTIYILRGGKTYTTDGALVEK